LSGLATVTVRLCEDTATCYHIRSKPRFCNLSITSLALYQLSMSSSDLSYTACILSFALIFQLMLVGRAVSLYKMICYKLYCYNRLVVAGILFEIFY